MDLCTSGYNARDSRQHKHLGIDPSTPPGQQRWSRGSDQSQLPVHAGVLLGGTGLFQAGVVARTWASEPDPASLLMINAAKFPTAASGILLHKCL